MSDENDSWLKGIGVDVSGIVGSVQEVVAAPLPIPMPFPTTPFEVPEVAPPAGFFDGVKSAVADGISEIADQASELKADVVEVIENTTIAAQEFGESAIEAAVEFGEQAVDAVEQATADGQLLSDLGGASNTSDLDKTYLAARKKPDWPEAAKLLNGFSEHDINERLKDLDREEILLLHDGAIKSVGLDSNVARLTAHVAAEVLDEKYRAAVGKPDWEMAAEYLNGFSPDDIRKRLGNDQGLKTNLHHGALNNPRVGPNSNVAKLTGPAFPTNLRLTGIQNNPLGFGFRVAHSWESSSGNLQDLAGGEIREMLTYSTIPNPPYGLKDGTKVAESGRTNEERSMGPLARGSFVDRHRTPREWIQQVPPRAEGSYTVTQTYDYKLAGSSNWVTFAHYTITSTVFKEGDKWMHKMIKVGRQEQAGEASEPMIESIS
jgi:hypothetical protein